MAHRGRASAAELASVRVLMPMGRPDPLAELTREQATEWSAIVSRMPADWFPRETHALLAQLCRHIVRARKLAKRLDEPGLSPDMEIRLSREQREETKSIVNLQTATRLTQHSRYDKKKTTGPTHPRPWGEA